MRKCDLCRFPDRLQLCYHERTWRIQKARGYHSGKI